MDASPTGEFINFQVTISIKIVDGRPNRRYPGAVEGSRVVDSEYRYSAMDTGAILGRGCNRNLGFHYMGTDMGADV